MKKISTVLTLVVFFVLFALSTQSVSADTHSINFENPPYMAGTINAQDGWASLGSIGSGCAIYDHAVFAHALFPTFGNQSLRISDAVTSGCFGDQTFAKPLVNAVGEVDATAGSFTEGTRQKHFEMQFDIASASPSAQQPGLHISVSPDRGDGSRMSYLRFEDGAAGIDVFFDDVQGTTNPANFVETQIATGLNRAIPHKIKLVMDVVNGPSNDIVKVWIDGTLVITGTSWENYYRFDTESSAEQSPRITKTIIFRSGGGAVPANLGKGFLFDNLSLSSGPVLIAPPTNKDQCKNNGWKIFNNPSFKNQGACVEYVEHLKKDHKKDKEHDEHEDKESKHKNGKSHDHRRGHRNNHFDY